MKYVLILFAKSTDQTSFVNQIAYEVGQLSENENVSYYYGDESIIYTFDTNEPFELVKMYIEDLFTEFDLVYFLTEFKPDHMSSNMNKEVYKHLFNQEKFTILSESSENLDSLNQEVDEKIYSLKRELMNMIQGGEEKIPSLNELLDKINLVGMNNLTKKDLTLLNKYSNQI